MIKKFRNIYTGSTFTAIDVDIATAKYFGIFEFSNGVVEKRAYESFGIEC